MLGVCLYYIGNNMETSGLLLVSEFCKMQRTPQFEGKDTTFSKYPMIYKRNFMEFRTFSVIFSTR